MTPSFASGPTDKQSDIANNRPGHSAHRPTALQPLGNRPAGVRGGGHGPLQLAGRQQNDLFDARIGREDGVLRNRRDNLLAEVRGHGVRGVAGEGDLDSHKAAAVWQVGGDDQADEGAGGDEESGLEGMGDEVYWSP